MPLKTIIAAFFLTLMASSGHAGYFGTKILQVNPGGPNYFEIDTENPHFRNSNCLYFGMGKFQSSDPATLSRTYSAVMSAALAKADVVVWFNDNDPCKVDIVIVKAP